MTMTESKGYAVRREKMGKKIWRGLGNDTEQERYRP